MLVSYGSLNPFVVAVMIGVAVMVAHNNTIVETRILTLVYNLL